MRRRDRIALGLVAIVLVVAPFALGGAPRWAICLLGALSVACGSTFVTSPREMGAVSPLFVLVTLAATLTFLQVVPLPSPVVETLSPGKYELVAENARSIESERPKWMALSLDPPASLLELAKLCGYVAFAYAALRIAANATRRQWLLSVVGVVGVAMAMTAALHVALGAETLFGVYRPREAMTRPTLAPLLNHNHLSAMMAFTAPIAIGLALNTRARLRVAWFAGAALCAGVGLLAESRGGAIALAVGLMTLAIFVIVQQRGGRQSARLKSSDIFAIGVIATSALILLGLLTAGGVARDLSATRLGEISDRGSRFQVWRETSQLLSEYRLTGVGRGAFESVSTRIHDSSTVVYPHVENEYLQAVVDWGLLGAAALALVVVWLTTIAARNARATPWEAGAFASIIALAVENLNDFSFWMPGIAYPTIAAFAALSWNPVSESSRLPRNALVSLRSGVLVALAAAVAIAASPLGRQAHDETQQLARNLEQQSARTQEAQARAMWRRHPSSFAAAGHLARALFIARDPRAIGVANRALMLHPTNGELHRLVAQMLLMSQQRAQARTEYALAMRYRPSLALMDEIMAAFPSDEDLVRALPLEPKLIQELSDRLAERGRVGSALVYMERYVSFYPQDSRVLIHAATFALNSGDSRKALTFSEQAFSVDPAANAAIVLAQSLTRTGTAGEAVTLLQTLLERGHLAPEEKVNLLLALADTQIELGRIDAARHSLASALPLTSGPRAATVHRKLADVEERSGNRHQAEWERHRAEALEQ